MIVYVRLGAIVRWVLCTAVLTAVIVVGVLP